jgi:hypothetical protein
MNYQFEKSCDEYFKARPQLESAVNRGIFQAGYSAALAAQPGAVGWVMVPAEPTELMLTYVHRQAYINALSARPSAPTAVEPPYPMATTIEGAAQDVAKWLNERPNSPLDLRHVAMLVHAVQTLPTAVEPDERAEFEAAYRARYPVSCDLDPEKFNRSDEGDYEDIRVSIAWAMWQARASKGTPL